MGKKRTVGISVFIIAASMAFAGQADPAQAMMRQGTDGTEMQAAVPSRLEIRLGEEWAGAQFRLVTDAGEYPDLIPADGDGVLRTEIGGSTEYVLTYAGMAETGPGDEGQGNDPEDGTIGAGWMDDPKETGRQARNGIHKEAGGADKSGIKKKGAGTALPGIMVSAAREMAGKEVLGIPLWHIFCLFGVAAAVATVLGRLLSCVRRKRGLPRR